MMLMLMMLLMMIIMMIMLNDDDDDVERTHTGPHAVRSDLEHQVNHNAKISHVFHVLSSYEEGGPTGAGKSRCLAVTLLWSNFQTNAERCFQDASPTRVSEITSLYVHVFFLLCVAKNCIPTNNWLLRTGPNVSSFPKFFCGNYIISTCIYIYMCVCLCVLINKVIIINYPPSQTPMVIQWIQCLGYQSPAFFPSRPGYRSNASSKAFARSSCDSSGTGNMAPRCWPCWPW